MNSQSVYREFESDRGYSMHLFEQADVDDVADEHDGQTVTGVTTTVRTLCGCTRTFGPFEPVDADVTPGDFAGDHETACKTCVHVWRVRAGQAEHITDYSDHDTTEQA